MHNGKIRMASIDVEDENILTTIFKTAFPASWQENPDFLQYLVELSSCGVEKLAREPDRLAEESAQILEETQDLAFHNYTTFIQTADCSKEIFQDFQIIEKNLDNVLEKLPPFAEECKTVVKKAQEISSSRQMNTLTLQRHTQLLEILEMPQLMDTCVRNGYYEEALELTSHVKRLEKKLAHIPVIMSIVSDIKNSTQLMLNELLQQLRTNLQLPACLRVIGYLRQMDVFTEAELRIKFLQVTQFLSTLECDLLRGVGGRLDSLLGQCMYFGLSFSRVGADFRGLLAPIFQRAAVGYFQAALSEANKNFEENMQSYNLLGVPTSTGGSTAPYGSISQAGQNYPPTMLLDFYPLAAYCNHVLSAFNELRLCAPVNIASEIADALQRSLIEVNRVILAFFRAEETTFNEQEKDQFGQFCATYMTDLLPYMNKCLHIMFPPSQLASSLGITVSEMSKMGNIGMVDLNVVLTQVEHLIPKVEEVPPASTPAATTHVPVSAAPTPTVSVITDTQTPDSSQSEVPTEPSPQDNQSDMLSHPTETPTSQSDTLEQKSPQTEGLANQSEPSEQQSPQTEGLTSQSDALAQQSPQTEGLASQSDALAQQSPQNDVSTSQSDPLQHEVNPVPIQSEISEQNTTETVSESAKDKSSDLDSSRRSQDVSQPIESEIVSDVIDLDNLPFEMDSAAPVSSDLDSVLNIDTNLAQSLATNVLDSPSSYDSKQD